MMFEFNPDMVMADDDEADVDMTLYKREDLDEEVSSLLFFIFSKNCMFYQLLRVLHSSSSTQS